jgi:tRNA (cmo5U34)-methyltransferase
VTSHEHRGWDDPVQVDEYLGRIATLEPRLAGELVLLDVVPRAPQRVLDLGCGDGRLAALLLDHRASIAEVVAVDVSPPMLRAAAERFDDDDRVEVRTWDLNEPIGELGTFDVIVSGFAIHHLDDVRKEELVGEIAGGLRPGGVFANLEVVRSATPELHATFRAAIGRTHDDPADQLVDVETQLGWMRTAGLEQVDCIWRWRGFALLVGQAPSSVGHQSVGR